MNVEKHIIKIWNEKYPLDPVSPEILRYKYLDSPYLKPVGKIVSEEAFSLSGVRTSNFLYGDDSEDGWILWAGFQRRKSLISLIESQIKEFETLGAKKVSYSSFTPYYFLPGVDRSAYPELYEVLHEIGFRVNTTALSMAKNLDTLDETPLAEAPGIHIADFMPIFTEQLLDFIEKNFNSDWYFRAEAVASKGEPEQICLALKDDEIVGYSMFSGPEGKHWFMPGERFGPFGVREDFRGKGIGKSLLGRTLLHMRSRGIKVAYFLWTDEKASHLYHRFGFMKKRTFEIMELKL